MAEVVGIKEIVELLEGVKLLGINGKKVMADGKVDFSDFPVVLELLKQYATLVEAVKGLDQVPAEVKDLSADEAQVILAKVVEIVAALKAA